MTLLVFTIACLAMWSKPALAQDLNSAASGSSLPTIWYLLAAGLAMLVPAGFVLLGAANLEQTHAWNAALGGLAAAGLALMAYWAVGFALQFGGVGLVYDDPGLRGLVWEWSPLSSEWGIGWGMAGLTGWFLTGSATGVMTPLAYTLFLAHIPWVMLAALLPVMTLRGRAPSTVTLVLAVVMGGVIYPLAGNWVQGGGWLNALGRNLNLGHGFVDFGGSGSVHLVAAAFGLAALTVWSTRRRDEQNNGQPEQELPHAHQPLLAVVGALLILGGGIGWMFGNPLQVSTIGNLGMMRGAASMMLAAAGGLLFPLLYTWFVTGRSEPTMSARGFAAGVVAGLACAPFVAPGIAFITGVVAGATVPFVTWMLNGKVRVEDRTGVVISSGIPALIGLLLVGIFADGAAGSGWQATGVNTYLGVAGQGVSGLTVASGYQMDFPGQLQAQVIGIAALALWGFLTGLIVCVPLGLLFHSLLRRQDAPVRRPVQVPAQASVQTPVALAAAQTYAAEPMPRQPTTGAPPMQTPTPSLTPATETRMPGYAPAELRPRETRAPEVQSAPQPAPFTPAQPNSEPSRPAPQGELPPNPRPKWEYDGANARPQSTSATPMGENGKSTERPSLETLFPREGYWPDKPNASAAPTATPGERNNTASTAPAALQQQPQATDPYASLEAPPPHRDAPPQQPAGNGGGLSQLLRRRRNNAAPPPSEAKS